MKAHRQRISMRQNVLAGAGGGAEHLHSTMTVACNRSLFDDNWRREAFSIYDESKGVSSRRRR